MSDPVRKYLLLFLVPVLGHVSLQAQILGSVPEGKGKVWNIHFVIDPGLTTAWANYRDSYQGERFLPATDSTFSRWTWANWDTTNKRVLDFYKVGTLRLGVLVNLVDQWYIGVNYCGYLIQGFNPSQTSGYNYVYWPFYSLSGSVQYNYAFPFLQQRISLQPTLSAGTYQSERTFEGIGQELSFEGRLALAYQVNQRKGHEIRVWGNYQHMTYRSVEQSLVFPERQRSVATDWSLVSAGVGLVWHLSIEEDPGLDEGDRQSKKRRKANRLDRKRERLERKLDS